MASSLQSVNIQHTKLPPRRRQQGWLQAGASPAFLPPGPQAPGTPVCPSPAIYRAPARCWGYSSKGGPHGPGPRGAPCLGALNDHTVVKLQLRKGARGAGTGMKGDSVLTGNQGGPPRGGARMEKMRGSQGRQKPRPVSKGPGAGKTSDDGETAESPVGPQQWAGGGGRRWDPRGRGQIRVCAVSGSMGGTRGSDLFQKRAAGCWIQLAQAGEGQPCPSSAQRGHDGGSRAARQEY